MNFPVFSQLAGNFGFPETGSLETASSSGESGELPTRVGYQAQDLCFQPGGVGSSAPAPGSLAPLRKSGIQGTRAIVRGWRPPCATWRKGPRGR
jgi:hypothetical protein